MQQQLEQVFGPPDRPMSIPSEFHELMKLDPAEGGEIVLSGIQSFLGWLGDFLLNEPLQVIVIAALIVIILFALPSNGGTNQ